ncbi:hypothetical protein NUW54_g2482 [Trametes sanguinea]|uniref:Uncharacterized protein n=1 Tax=Trametes sanguinea TaxID=158606 RepID=A0ACC1Q6K3_9APHY|nr:hypothetical protein NUW54_g2482 [Trametes sanguinea]
MVRTLLAVTDQHCLRESFSGACSYSAKIGLCEQGARLERRAAALHLLYSTTATVCINLHQRWPETVFHSISRAAPTRLYDVGVHHTLSLTVGPDILGAPAAAAAPSSTATSCGRGMPQQAMPMQAQQQASYDARPLHGFEGDGDRSMWLNARDTYDKP